MELEEQSWSPWQVPCVTAQSWKNYGERSPYIHTSMRNTNNIELVINGSSYHQKMRYGVFLSHTKTLQTLQCFRIVHLISVQSAMAYQS